MRLTRTQGEKINRMRDAVSDSKRVERDARAAADQEEHEGQRDRAARGRATADGIRRNRQKMETEIADRQANPGKWRW